MEVIGLGASRECAGAPAQEQTRRRLELHPRSSSGCVDGSLALPCRLEAAAGACACCAARKVRQCCPAGAADRLCRRHRGRQSHIWSQRRACQGRLYPFPYGQSPSKVQSHFYPVQQSVAQGHALQSLFSTTDKTFHAKLRRAVSNAYAMSTLVGFEPFCGLDDDGVCVTAHAAVCRPTRCFGHLRFRVVAAVLRV